MVLSESHAPMHGRLMVLSESLTPMHGLNMVQSESHAPMHGRLMVLSESLIPMHGTPHGAVTVLSPFSGHFCSISAPLGEVLCHLRPVRRIWNDKCFSSARDLVVVLSEKELDVAF